MERSPNSVRLVVEEEKHGNSASIQASCFLGSSRERLPLVGVTRHPLAEPDLRVSRYRALPFRFAEDILSEEAYQHGASDDMAYRGSVCSCVELPSVAAIAASHELHPCVYERDEPQMSLLLCRSLRTVE